MTPSSSGHVNMMKGQPFHVKYREIIRRMMFLIGALLVFRLGAHIPVPGINNAALENLFNANQGTILGLFNMFSGGALERMSILALGIMPYISASIIVQLMSTVVPSLEALKKEGEQGKRKINQYTRQGTLFLAFHAFQLSQFPTIWPLAAAHRFVVSAGRVPPRSSERRCPPPYPSDGA